MKLKSIFSIIILFAISCVKEVPLPIREAPKKLVVDGMITTEAPPYIIYVGYTGIFNFLNNPDDFAAAFAINDASVSITDDRGQSYNLGLGSSGRYYTPPNFKGEVGRSYTLTIRLTDGKEFRSSTEKLSASPPIKSLQASYHDLFTNNERPDGHNLYVSTKDTPNEPNNYLWTAHGFVHRKAVGEWDAWCRCYVRQYCWQRIQEQHKALGTDNGIDGGEIQDKFVMFVPSYWYGYQFLEVQQYSISPNAYKYWKFFEEQRTRVGSIFDPLPALVPGNVRNVKNNDDFTLGYFMAAGISRKRTIIKNDSLTEEHLINARAIKSQFIPNGACENYIINTTVTGPTNW